MARPLDIQRRRTIAHEAFEVIKEQGVHKITMSHLAKALNMKRPTLYWYFPDVESVFEAVVDNIIHRVIIHTTEAMGRHSHPVDQLDAMLRAVVEFYMEHRTELMGMIQLWSVGSSNPERLVAHERELLKPQREFLVSLVQGGIDRGQIKPCDAGGLADTMITLIDGANFHRMAYNDDLSLMLNFVSTHILHPLRIPQQEVK